MFKLWESGVIEFPNELGVENRGWDLKIVGTHKEVEQRILEDKYAIGATGQFSNQDKPKNALVKVLLRYYYLPQDILVISKNLMPYKVHIENWFKNTFKDGSEKIPIFFNSSNRITGLYPLNEEFKNSLNELEIMTRHVHNFQEGTRRGQYNSEQGKEGENLLISSNLKKLLAKYKFEDVIDNLIEHFSTLKNNDALNQVIMHSTTFHMITKQENLSTVDYETITRKKNQLNKALLSLIDNELENL